MTQKTNMSHSSITEEKHGTAEMLNLLVQFRKRWQTNTLPQLGHHPTAFEVNRILVFRIFAGRVVKPGKRLPRAVVQSPSSATFIYTRPPPTLLDVETSSSRLG